MTPPPPPPISSLPLLEDTREEGAKVEKDGLGGSVELGGGSGVEDGLGGGGRTRKTTPKACSHVHADVVLLTKTSFC